MRLSVKPTLLSVLSTVILYFSIITSSLAVEVSDLYAVRVPIWGSDTFKDPKLQNEKVQEAFKKVLIKVSGSPEVVLQRDIKTLIPLAENYVEQLKPEYSKDKAAPHFLLVKFQEKAIQDVLQNAKVPIWDKNRPLAILWLVSSDQNPQFLINPDTSPYPELGIKVQGIAAERGVPLVFPTLDLENLTMVSPRQILAGDLLNVDAISKRYGSDMVVIGKVSRENWRIQWQLYSGKELIEWRSQGATLDESLVSGIGNIATILSSQYTHSLQQQQKFSTQRVVLSVQNIRSLQDFEEAKAYLEKLGVVQEMNVKTITKNGAVFEIKPRGGLAAIKQAIQLDGKQNLEFVAESVPMESSFFGWERGSSGAPTLTYNWVQ